jgi:hypothetical protein
MHNYRHLNRKSPPHIEKAHTVDYVEDLAVADIEDDFSSDNEIDHIDHGTHIFGQKLRTKYRLVTEQTKAENIDYDRQYFLLDNGLHSEDTVEQKNSENLNFQYFEDAASETENRRRPWPSHRYTQRVMTPWPVSNHSVLSHRESKSISRQVHQKSYSSILSKK